MTTVTAMPIRSMAFQIPPGNVSVVTFGEDTTGETVTTFAKTPHSVTKVWAARNTVVQRFGPGQSSSPSTKVRALVEGVTITVNFLNAPGDDSTIALDGTPVQGAGSDWANAQMFWGMLDDAVTNVVNQYNTSVAGSAAAAGENRTIKVVPRYLSRDTEQTETWISTASALGVSIREVQPYSAEVIHSPAKHSRKSSSGTSRRSSNSHKDGVVAHAWVRDSQKGTKSGNDSDLVF